MRQAESSRRELHGGQIIAERRICLHWGMRAYSAVERGIAPRPIFTGFAQDSRRELGDLLVSEVKLT